MRRLILGLLTVLALPALASAQITATYLQSADDPADTATYTFTAQNLGTAASDRYITVVITGRKSGTTNCATPTNVTIGGVTAAFVISRDRAITNCNVASIYKANVPTGTTGDIVVGWGFTYLQTHIAVYRSTGGQTTAASTSGGSSIDDPTLTYTIPANGYSVGGAINNSGAATATWTGLTETYDSVMTSGGTTMVTGGLLNPSTVQTSLTVLIDWTTSGTESVGVFAAWAPVASGSAPPPTLTVLGVGAP